MNLQCHEPNFIYLKISSTILHCISSLTFRKHASLLFPEDFVDILFEFAFEFFPFKLVLEVELVDFLLKRPPKPFRFPFGLVGDG